MRPINSGQRRRQFLLFILLFALATTPVVVLAYLNGRLDAAHERLLGQDYEVSHRMGSDVRAVKEDLKTLKEHTWGLRHWFVDQGDSLQDLEGDQEQVILAKLGEIEQHLPSAEDGEVQDALRSAVSDLVESFKMMNNAYGHARDEIGRLKQEKEACEQRLRQNRK